MAQAPVLYRETRLTPAPASPSHVLNIDTSASSHRQSLIRAGSKRTFDDTGLDEESYARKHLATEGSVFFRSKARAPRNILWRVLDDRKVLEIQAVDLIKDKGRENADSWLTYRVTFKEAILEHGVQLADAAETDALECFVLTEGRELLTVTLKRNLLTRESVPSDFDPSTCVKRYSSSFLSVRQPYRFQAVSSLELLVSLADGGLVRLQRKANESGAQWRETFFSEGGWRGTLTLKGLNPFAGRPVVRHGNLELDPTAVADMVMSPDGKYVWTVSLDHCLRAWSTATGKVAMKQDLLNESHERNSRQPYTMSAEQGRLLQIVTLPSQADSQAVSRMDEDGRYAIVLQTPRDHQFKLFDVAYTRVLDGEGVQTEDLYPDTKLIAPVEELMNTNIWHLEHFHVQPGADWAGTQFWIRARSGALCKTFVLMADLLSAHESVDELSAKWSHGWATVDTGSSTIEVLKESADYPGELAISADSPTTPSEMWLQFLFYPSRFTVASLETTLYIYRKGRGLSGSSGRAMKTADQPLQERITAAITAKVILRRLPKERPDYQRYQQDIQAQWEAFWSVLSHVHTRRHEPVGFAFDAEDGEPWAVCADFVAPVRACSGLEQRVANSFLLQSDAGDELYDSIYPKRLDLGNKSEKKTESMHLTQLLASAHELRSALSPATNGRLQQLARQSALESRETSDGLALSLFEGCKMSNDITDEIFDAVTDGVESLKGLDALTDQTFLSVLRWLDDQPKLATRGDSKVLGRYGVSFAVEVAREMLVQTETILLDVLALVALMVGEVEEGGLHANLNADQTYVAVVERLKQNQLLLWLAGHEREKAMKFSDSRGSSEHESGCVENVTLLEDVFIGDWKSYVPDGQSNMPELLTVWSSNWISGPTLQDEAHWNGATTHILSRLVKANEIGLAVDFLQFTDGTTPWTVYVQGRLHISTGDYARASLDFQQAAEGMAKDRMNDTASLIQAHEAESFGSGKAAYFQHVAALFEKLQVYSYVVDFARLALENTEPLADFSRSMARLDKQKSQQESPALEKARATQEEARLLRLKGARDEILNRLFNALVLTGRFSEACGALQQIEDSPMKRSGLKKLIEACVKQDCVPTLLSLPFEGDLAQEADKTLLDKAKRELASGSNAATPYYQILYAYRTKRSNFRGAAEVLYERMRCKHRSSQDPEDETLLHSYTLLINTLACCGEDDGWILAEPVAGVQDGPGTRRKLVTLADIRMEYTAELDRRSEILQGRFPLVGGADDMDVL